MSKILKKITKKYKWLRFLNYKTTKLAVLSAALFGLCLSSGASFAKYRDENYGNGNAGIATMGDVVVTYYEEGVDPIIQLPKEGTAGDEGWHVFIATIKVQFFNVEVKQNFNITFKLGSIDNDKFSDTKQAEKTSFALKNSYGEEKANEITTYAKKSTDLPAEMLSIEDAQKVDKEYIALGEEFRTGWSQFPETAVSINTGYYGVEKVYSSDVVSADCKFDSDKWNKVTYVSDDSLKTEFTTKNEEVLPQNETTVFFYKILFFVDFTLSGKNINAEFSKIFYEINGWQVK